MSSFEYEIKEPTAKKVEPYIRIVLTDSVEQLLAAESLLDVTTHESVASLKIDSNAIDMTYRTTANSSLTCQLTTAGMITYHYQLGKKRLTVTSLFNKGFRARHKLVEASLLNAEKGFADKVTDLLQIRGLRNLLITP